MSARDDIIGMLDHAYPGGDYDKFDAYVTSILDTYRAEVLREAAEKIRNSETLRDWTDDHMSDCNMAADLIDPEVSSE